MPNVDINVHHVTRVEGHGNIRVKSSDGTIEKVEWQVPEAPRMFEAMVRGRSYQDVQTVTCRICGICSFSHTLAGIKAIEDAMDIEVSEQTDRLRVLAFHGEYVESHVLHVGYLVAPDLLGVKSVVPLVASHPDVVLKIIACHRLGNEWMEMLGGRRTHPVSFRPGGFGKLPTEAELRELKAKIVARIQDLKDIAEVVLSLAGKVPAFDRETEYIGLVDENSYSYYHGKIGSTDTDERVPVQEFERVANEYMVPQSTAKWTKWHRDAYAVGALARYKLNADKAHPLAAATAKAFGLTKDCVNPYMCSVAQIVETVHAVEDGLMLIDELLTKGIKPETPKVTPKAGTGVGCVEAPRGILFHKYTFDDKGICTAANITVPTHQNHGNIQKDFEALVPQIIDKPQDEITLLMEMLVRSYDPCISCSCHNLNVEFV